jgi:hypothetical protein
VRLAAGVLGIVLATTTSPAFACSIWEPAEYENGDVGRSERGAANFVFLGRVERVNPGPDHPSQLRFRVVAPLSGRGPVRLTADGDFWRCYDNPVATTIDWRLGQLAIVYGRWAPPTFGLIQNRFPDQPAWDGWQLLEAVPADRNRDPKIAQSLAQALRTHGH